MATRKTKRDEPQDPPGKLERPLMEQLMFGTGRVRRFTQDTPILPDVWLEYARGLNEEERQTRPERDDADDPFPSIKLLLMPLREKSSGTVAQELRRRLREERAKKEWRVFGHDPEKQPRVIYNQSTVAAKLYFEDLVRVALPMTSWWARLDQQWRIEGLDDPKVRDILAEAVRDPEHPPLAPTGEKKGEKRRLPPALLWMIRVVGALALVHRGQRLPEPFYSRRGAGEAEKDDWLVLVDAVADAIRGVSTGPEKGGALVHSISLNRQATPTIARSTLAVKADAARRLFDISCADLAWAIIDSGIDARHPAFRKRKDLADDEKRSLRPNAFGDTKRSPENCTRIVETYDFSQIDILLDFEASALPKNLEKRLKGKKGEALREQLEILNDSLSSGRSVDWKLIAPLLLIPQDEGEGNYTPPGNDHGTHVAGILAGDWKKSDEGSGLEDDLVGICPDLRLYDLRVLDGEGRGDEFSVMAALQFIRYLNSTNDYMAVHGVNMSLSIPHDVSNYACGRTPVCDECERVISSGVVVVAAAGNQGYRKYTTSEGVTAEVYSSASITDPGNAELVITVGATHRYRPHTYGVSYFSSRGPTGDGRSKPDLVAPGEKITAPLPDGAYGLKDGTSMAAPHVSGAAALLMARHNELVGRPARIKQILCETATDLGRERYFQGAGMLDALRALQSV